MLLFQLRQVHTGKTLGRSDLSLDGDIRPASLKAQRLPDEHRGVPREVLNVGLRCSSTETALSGHRLGGFNLSTCLPVARRIEHENGHQHHSGQADEKDGVGEVDKVHRSLSEMWPAR